MLFVKRVVKRNIKIVASFILGSMDCRNPFFDAYSSEKMDSFKKDRAPMIERSIKLLSFDTWLDSLSLS